MVELGDEVQCMVSGFKGIVIGKSEFLHGCSRVGVQPKVGKDGKLVDAQWFDEPQMTVTKKRKVKVGRRDVGGPLPSTPTRNQVR